MAKASFAVAKSPEMVYSKAVLDHNCHANLPAAYRSNRNPRVTPCEKEGGELEGNWYCMKIF
jgi:hypothetical protein